MVPFVKWRIYGEQVRPEQRRGSSDIFEGITSWHCCETILFLKSPVPANSDMKRFDQQ